MSPLAAFHSALQLKGVHAWHGVKDKALVFFIQAKSCDKIIIN